MKLEQATNYEPAFDMHATQRFHDHFVITKMLVGYYRGYNPGVSQGID
jgi:hypothetical protein